MQRATLQLGHSQNKAMTEGLVWGEDCPGEFSLPFPWLWAGWLSSPVPSRRNISKTQPKVTIKVLPANQKGGLSGAEAWGDHRGLGLWRQRFSVLVP